jgi:hypothetical protein
MDKANGQSEWTKRMDKANGQSEWTKRMDKANGATVSWATFRKGTTCIREKFCRMRGLSPQYRRTCFMWQPVEIASYWIDLA